MAGNATPIFGRVGQIGQGVLTTGNTGSDLSTNAALIFTADATNGSILNEIRVKYKPGISTTATAFRVWINNGSSEATATNNSLITEITIPIITTSQTAGTTDFVIPLSRGGIVLPPGYKVYVTCGTTQAASASLMVSAYGGDY